MEKPTKETFKPILRGLDKAGDIIEAVSWAAVEFAEPYLVTAIKGIQRIRKSKDMNHDD